MYGTIYIGVENATYKISNAKETKTMKNKRNVKINKKGGGTYGKNG